GLPGYREVAAPQVAHRAERVLLIVLAPSLVLTRVDAPGHVLGGWGAELNRHMAQHDLGRPVAGMARRVPADEPRGGAHIVVDEQHDVAGCGPGPRVSSGHVTAVLDMDAAQSRPVGG